MEKVLLRARAFDTRINAGARSVSSQFVFGCVRGLMAVEAAITRLIETHTQKRVRLREKHNKALTINQSRPRILK